MLSINSLHDELLERQNKKNRIYEEVLEKIIAKIKYVNSISNDCYLVYTLPNFIYGIPLFNVIECGNYLFKRLNNVGFVCKYNQKHNLFISWKTRPTKEKTLIPFQTTQPKSTDITYPNSNNNNFLTLKNEPNMLKMKKFKTNTIQNKQHAFSEVDKMFLNIDSIPNSIQNINNNPNTNQHNINTNPNTNQYNQITNNQPSLGHTDNFYFYQGQNNNQYINPGNYNNTPRQHKQNKQQKQINLQNNNIKSISYTPNNFTQLNNTQQYNIPKSDNLSSNDDNLDEYLGTLL